MPFDQHLGASAARQLALARELGQTYVPLSGRPPEFAVLDPVRAETLRSWVATLVPGNDVWPSAAERGVAEYVDNNIAKSGNLRRMLVAAVDDLDSRARTRGHDGFSAATQSDREEILREFEQDSGADFAIVLELTFEGYYRDRFVAHVVERQTGFRVSGPLAGITDEPFDPSLLDDIRERPKSYREVSA